MPPPPAEGFRKVPNRVFGSRLSPEAERRPYTRLEAVFYLLGKASYTERPCPGAEQITLQVGETSALSLRGLASDWRWTEKAVRVFLAFLCSDAAQEEIGMRFRQGQKVVGHHLGHHQGHHLGHTYLVSTKVVTGGQGHHLGHPLGHPQGHHLKDSKEIVINSPLRGESREGVSDNGTAKRKRAVPRLLPDDWEPTEKHFAACAAANIDLPALSDDFRFFWRETNGMKADWNLTFTKRIAAVRSTGQFRLNGRRNGSGPSKETIEAMALRARQNEAGKDLPPWVAEGES